VPRGYRGNQKLEYKSDQRGPLYVAEARCRGTQVVGHSAQKTIPTDIQQSIHRIQLQSTYSDPNK